MVSAVLRRSLHLSRKATLRGSMTIAAASASLASVGCTTLPSQPDVPRDTVELAQRRQGDPIRHDSPEIAKSRGDKGGYIVLWPRIVPKADDDETREIASLLQARLRAMAERGAGGGPGHHVPPAVSKSTAPHRPRRSDRNNASVARRLASSAGSMAARVPIRPASTCSRPMREDERLPSTEKLISCAGIWAPRPL